MKYIYFNGSYITAQLNGHIKELVNFLSRHYEDVKVVTGILPSGNNAFMVPSNVSEGISEINSKWLEQYH